MTRAERRAELERLARGKNGMLTLQRMRQIACGEQPGSMPKIRRNDSLERMIQEILDYEFPAGTGERPSEEIPPSTE